MNFQIAKEALTEALSFVAQVVGDKHSIPQIGTHFRLEAESFGILAVATDLDTWTQVEAPAVVTEPGAVLLALKPLQEWLAYAGPSVAVETVKTGLRFKAAGAGAITFKTLPPEEFPSMPEFNGKPVFVADLKDVAKIRAAAFKNELAATSNNYGYFVEKEGDGLIVFSTNGREVGILEVPAQLKAPFSLRVPPEAMEMAFRMGEVVVQQADNFILFSTENRMLASKKYALEGPNWRSVLNSEMCMPLGRCQLVHEEFRDIIASCHVLRGNDTFAAVSIKCGTDEIIVTSEANGSFSASVPCKIISTWGTLMFSSRYLLDFLSAASEEDIIDFRLEDHKAGRLKAGRVEYVIMPLHRPENEKEKV